MAHNCFRLHKVCAALVKTKETVVLTARRNGGTFHTLKLHAQHVYDIHLRNNFIKVSGLRATEPLGIIYLERRGSHKRYLSTHGLERRGKRASNAAVRQIAHNGNLKAIQMSEVFTNGIEVKHGLRGVLMFAVTCVDHDRVGVFRNALRRTRQARTTYKHVYVHCIDGLNRVC